MDKEVKMIEKPKADEFIQVAKMKLAEVEDRKCQEFRKFIASAESLNKRKCEEFKKFIGTAEEIIKKEQKGKDFKNFIRNIENKISEIVEKFDEKEKELFRLWCKFEESGKTLNIFDAFGYDEGPYRDFLVWLLRKEGSHGLGDKFAKSFVNYIVKKIGEEEFSDDEFRNCEVKKEVPLKGKSIDFIITGESLKGGKIMRRLKQVLLVLIVFYLSGCAWTTLNTVKNPELYQVNFRKLLVVAPFSDIGLRKQTENAFIAQFNLSGVNAFSSIELIPPVKEYNEQELLNILEQNNIDGVLVVGLQDYWTSQAYIPKSSSSRGSASLYGNSLYYQSYTQEYGGYYISMPRVKFEIRLFDSKSGQVAWLATSFTRGNAFANYNTLVNSLAKEVVKKLIEENVIRK